MVNDGNGMHGSQVAAPSHTTNNNNNIYGTVDNNNKYNNY